MTDAQAPLPPAAPISQSQQLLALREAALAIAEDLSLADTLQHIVAAAAHLANARYGALGVPDESGQGSLLAEFVTEGLSAKTHTRIGHPPRGHGLLGLLARESHSLRLRDLRQHPLFTGFPPHHPVMVSFLGVPILYKNQRLGTLYLTDKQGAEEFTDADQSLIELLAAHAASAIQNARSFRATVQRSEELEARNRELAALNAVAVATSQYLDLNEVMTEALDQVLAVTGAEAGEIFLLNEVSGDMVLARHRGLSPEVFRQITRFKRGEGFPGLVAATGQPIISTDLARDERYLRREVVAAGFKACVCFPLFAKGKVVGSINLAARLANTLSESDLTLLAGIGHQVGVAVENARLYQQVAQLAVLEERQRIGMDLHDGVIQSIYAVGLTLEYVRGQLADGDSAGAHQRLGHALEALNTTIRDIRSYILDLRPRRFDGNDLATGLKQLLAEFKANTLMHVELHADPLAENGLTPESCRALFHIAQEALSNAARHSRASRLAVRLVDEGASVLLSIRDNGKGFNPDEVQRRVGHGLMNMRDRAAAAGGELLLESPAGGGVDVRVRLWRHRG